MTPVRVCPGVSCASALRAPRSLKLPVRWRCSCLQKICAPVSSLRAADSAHAVRMIAPFRRERAATISESETVEVGWVFMDGMRAKKNPEWELRASGVRAALICARLSPPRVGANNDRHDQNGGGRGKTHLEALPIP